MSSEIDYEFLKTHQPKFTNLQMPDNTPVGSVWLTGIKPLVNPQNPNDKPGFWESAMLGAKEVNTEYNFLAALSKQSQWARAGMEDVPQGWSQMNEEILEGVPVKYWARLLQEDVKTPAQQALRKKWIMEEDREEQYLSRGSSIGRLAGWLGGGLASVSTLIPIGAQTKMLTKSAGFFNNFAQAVPGMFAASAATSGARVANLEALTVEDWAKETFIGTVLGAAIPATMGLRAASKLQARGKYLENAFEDVEFVAKATNKGEFDGWLVRDPTGGVGADKVKRIQGFVDDGIDKLGESPWFKKIFSHSPYIRGMTSENPVIREWMSQLARPSNILTKRRATGNVEGFSAEQVFKGLQAEAYNLERKLNMAWESHLGISGPLADSQALIKKIKDGTAITRQQFYEQAAIALRNGDKHTTIPEITAWCNDARKHMTDLYKRAAQLDMDVPALDAITAQSYLMRSYNKIKMAADPDGFTTLVGDRIWYNSQRAMEYLAPRMQLIDSRASLKAEINALRKLKPKGYTRQVNKLMREKNELTQSIKDFDIRLQERITEGEIPGILLEGRKRFTAQELEQIKALQAPITKAEEAIKKARLAKDRELVKTLKKELELLRLDIESQVERKIIPRHFVKGKHTLVTELDQVKLRKPVKTREEAAEIAKRVFDTIMGEDEEQMMSRAFGEMRGTNPLTSRSLMVEDNHLQPWLNNDASRLMHLYTNFMGRRVGLGQMAEQYNTTVDKLLPKFKGKLKERLDNERAKIIKKFAGDQAKKEKALLKLQDKFDKDNTFLNKTWDVYWGNYNKNQYSPKTRAFLNGARAWTVTRALGALPIIQATELGQLVKAYGFAPVMDNMFKMISSTLKGKGALFAREDLAPARLAINTYLAKYSDQLYGDGTQYMSNGWLGRFWNMAASKFGNFTGANQMIDGMQHIAGVISQDKTIKALRKIRAGEKISKAESERLILAGFAPELEKVVLTEHSMADRILKMYDKHKLKAEGGYIPNFTKWEDFEASQFFLNSIQQEVQSVILTPNYYDVPLAYHDPVFGSLMMFWGYSFAATNARLIPLLQRPDASMLMGELFTMSLAAWVDPLRQYVSGRDVKTDNKSLLASALTNGAPGGIHMDLFNRINNVFDIPFLESFKNDRYQGKGFATLFAGALGSLGDDVTNVLNMMISGQITESRARKALKTIPYLSIWWNRDNMEALVKSWNLSKNKRNTGWFSESRREFKTNVDSWLGEE